MSEIQDPRFKIWDLSFVIFGSRHDIFVVQSSRFEIFLGNQCALSDSISLFCIFLCHMNISCSCWFFFHLSKCRKRWRRTFSASLMKSSPRRQRKRWQQNWCSKNRYKQFYTLLYCFTVLSTKRICPMLSKQKKRFACCGQILFNELWRKRTWRRICSTHHSQEWEEGGAEERDTQGKKEGPHWGETVLERNWNTSETIIWC